MQRGDAKLRGSTCIISQPMGGVPNLPSALGPGSSLEIAGVGCDLRAVLDVGTLDALCCALGSDGMQNAMKTRKVSTARESFPCGTGSDEHHRGRPLRTRRIVASDMDQDQAASAKSHPAALARLRSSCSVPDRVDRVSGRRVDKKTSGFLEFQPMNGSSHDRIDVEERKGGQRSGGDR